MQKEASAEKLEEDVDQPVDKKAVEIALSTYKEPFSGNVSNCTPLPPDCQDSKRKGLLEFDARFEGGVIFFSLATDV